MVEVSAALASLVFAEAWSRTVLTTAPDSAGMGGIIRQSGVFGWLAIFAALFLIVYGCLTIALRPPRKAFVVLAVLSLLPPTLGGIGTLLEPDGSPAVHASEEPALAPRVRRVPLKVGLVAGAPVLALAVVGLAFPRRSESSGTEPRS